MPWTHTRVIGEGGGWRSEHFEGVQSLSSMRSLNKPIVKSQKIWKEGPRVSFIYSRSLKFRAVEKKGRNTRSRKLKKKKNLKKLKRLTKI